ncbi:MAG TPA: arylsulfatase, partial [Chitinophagaceae bacterium]
ALVVMTATDKKPAGLQMSWPFPAQKGEQFQVNLQTKGGGKASFIVRLEKAGGDNERLIDEKVVVSAKVTKSGFQSLAIPEDGTYRVSFYLGTLEAGDKVWIDNVELIPVKKF